LEENLATFIDVILPLPLNKLFTYRIPLDEENRIKPGQRVAVQFGSKKIYAALVADIHYKPPKDYEAKYILNLIDDEPVINQHQLKFWQWLSAYYMCSIGDIMNAALPAALKLQSKTTITLNTDYNIVNTELDDKEYMIIEALELRKDLSIDDVIEVLQIKTVMPIIKSLHNKGLISLQENLEEEYKPKIVSCISLNTLYQDENNLEKLFNSLAKNEKQTNALLAYLHLKSNCTHVTKQQLLANAMVSASSLNTLVKKDIFTIYNLQTDRIIIDEIKEESFELNNDQRAAYEFTKENFNNNKTVLLHGITGSGKTHIYVNLIKEAINSGKQVLYLLPEIALTSQIVNRIKKYFGNKCISYHSKYNNNEKVEIWQKIQQKKINLVIGARSALFLPFNNLGLVVIDEEHESAYKQQDPAPRYNARDAAIYLAAQHKAHCILGSATPSFESYYNALNKRYALVNLQVKHSKAKPVNAVIADLAEDKRTKNMAGNYLTAKLFDAITEALKNQKQVILFQNRRGYAPVLECETCKWIPKCVNCDISLTYHKHIDSLKCHYCGYTRNVPASCPACGLNQLNFKGFGTEKIEDEINILFPEASVTRLDMDTAKTKYGHEQIIAGFENNHFDILVGTQMVSKGLDFENVNVAAVINADQLLFFPDFRAAERAFQLILQVSGRAGRRDTDGLAIIQTSMPGNFVIGCAASNNYLALYEHQLNERQKFKYPPFTRLVKIVVKHKDYKTAEQAALQLCAEIKLRVSATDILGPESPYVGKIRNWFIKELLIKIDKNTPGLSQIKNNIHRCMININLLKEFKNCIIYADVDPM